MHAEATGTAGLLAAETLDLDLITLDLGLPDLNGLDVAHKLRSVSEAPILMITAWAEPGDELNGVASGADAYLTKPFRPHLLRELVRRLCPPQIPTSLRRHTPKTRPSAHPPCRRRLDIRQDGGSTRLQSRCSPGNCRSKSWLSEQPIHGLAPGREEPGGTRRNVHAEEKVRDNPINRAGTQQGYP